MTVVLHKHKIANEKCAVCIHIFVAERHRGIYSIIFACLFFFEKLEDIQMILQLSRCLFATNIYEQNMIPMYDFMFMQHTSYSDKISL